MAVPKINMTQIELQNIMSDRIRIAIEKELTPEEREQENEQTVLVMGMAKQMIQNGDLILRTEKLMAQTKNLKESYAMKLITG